jgi:hypothetical protein
MQVAFALSMPSVASWNGKWSGAAKRYVIVRSFRKPPTRPDDSPVAPPGGGYYTYHFGDGWAAAVRAEEVDAPTARKLRRASDGFCGYDWMVDSILQHGRIRAALPDGREEE